jgi:hypothetical protein
MAGKKIEELDKAPALRDRSSLAEEYPEIARMWSKLKNAGFRASDFAGGSNVQAWFTCVDCGAEFQRPIYAVVVSWCNGHSCPQCSSFRADRGNRLVDKFPELAKEYCAERNDHPVDKLAYGSSRMAWWVCSRH